ncbi:RNA-directed DNA polymerase, eukaryota, reverse transcriptase zinc-binding domain protein [Tanacetum coccineum]
MTLSHLSKCGKAKYLSVRWNDLIKNNKERIVSSPTDDNIETDGGVDGFFPACGKELLIISIYAPHDLREKRSLWEYLGQFICNWDGDISSLIIALSLCVNIALMIMGPIPFNSIIIWFQFHGFDKLIEDSWKEIHISDNNAYLKLMKKLRLLKDKIKIWISVHKDKSSGRLRHLKSDLHNIDSVIDNGGGSEAEALQRSKLIRDILESENIVALELAQKAKIKWALEGDENSKYYHGVVNKKRKNLAIRGVLLDGTWLEKPHSVKNAFFEHFRDRFGNLLPNDISLDKELYANTMKEFRPISLIGSIYKIIAKILANRLVTVLDTLVSETQSAFVKDRQILDGPFILNELIQWCKKKKKKSMFFKVDFEKAFDSVRVWLAAGLFWLFKLNIMSLVHLFTRERLRIFMGHGCRQNINVLNHVLDVFFRASGLRINMHKSKLMGIAVESRYVEQAIAKIGCLSLKTPFNYLGSQVGGLMTRSIAWKDVLDFLEARLSRWKLNTLSIGGRLTLLKAVLGSIPTFYMSIFKVPKTVLHSMERIRARFFNGVDGISRKPSSVRWEKVMTAKDSGGLGIASFFALNRALLCKWIWKFITQKNSLWARVISANSWQRRTVWLISPIIVSILVIVLLKNLKTDAHGIDVLSIINLFVVMILAFFLATTMLRG